MEALGEHDNGGVQKMFRRCVSRNAEKQRLICKIFIWLYQIYS